MATLSSCLIWQIISFILPPNEYGCVYAWNIATDRPTKDAGYGEIHDNSNIKFFYILVIYLPTINFKTRPLIYKDHIPFLKYGNVYTSQFLLKWPIFIVIERLVMIFFLILSFIVFLCSYCIYSLVIVTSMIFYYYFSYFYKNKHYSE